MITRENYRNKCKVLILIVSTLLLPALNAQDRPCPAGEIVAEQASTPSADASVITWEYGAFVDSAYLNDFNYPANHLFRSRGTTYKVNEPIVNMGSAYVRKKPTETSRWGVELTAQAGQDSRVFGFSSTAPNLPGYRGLRHLGPTNGSYLAPIGKGLTVQGGIFSSFIGYDSLYAKDNLTYTRPWGADFTPYLMLGVNAVYPFASKLTGTLFVINGYWHLANANGVPTTGGQIAYKASEHVTVKQTAMYGPHQSDTALEFWRFLSDSIAEWKTEKNTIAFEYQVGTEQVQSSPSYQVFWHGAQLPIHHAFTPRWSGTIRPEFYWDPDGRLTGFKQSVKAITTAIEYRLPIRQSAAIFRLEHRLDDSRGPNGGFFRSGESAPGVPRLTAQQNLLTFAVILTFDSSFRTGGR